MDPYIVLIGDIEGSKQLDPQQRETAQKALKQVIREFNPESGALVSPHTITLGDEFQAVYSRADGMLGHTWRILAALYPVHVRFSVGLGGISTPVNPRQAIGMDGPAFHAARLGIDLLKKSGFLYQVQSEWSDEDSLESLINGALHLISRQMRGWNGNRFNILHRLYEGASYKKIAAELDISESAVYKNRESGSLDVILRLEKNISDLLNKQIGL